MQRLLTILLIYLQISDITWAISDKPHPYCDRNITETSYKTVIKTRVIKVQKKGFFNKLTLKKETQVEEYQEQEPVYKLKLERSCCDGYAMSDLMLCEPQCDQNGCPEHSKCVEPEVCECKTGYFSARSTHDGKHYCEPICEKTCPEHSACVAPNKCACKKGYHVGENAQCKPYCPSGCPHNGKCLAPYICACPEGYKAEHGSCIPICSLGDQCQNGRCIDKETCECNYGYVLNSETNICESNMAKFIENEENRNMESTSVNYEDSSESIDLPNFSLELQTDPDYDTFNDYGDTTAVYEENIDSTTYSSTEIDDNISFHKCADDFVFHQGQCKPLKFASQEIDCRFKPCNDPHAICLENGTCTCTEGYKRFRMPQKLDSNNTVKAICLTLNEYETGLLQLQEDTQKSKVPEHTNWTAIFFIVLGVLIIFIALVYLVWRLIRSQRGELDVAGKNLSCVYDNRAGLESEKSVI